MWYDVSMKKLFDDALHTMILSASGWRMIFAASGQEEDSTLETTSEKKALAVLAATAFAHYVRKKQGNACKLVIGMDSRPTGPVIADCILKALIAEKIDIQFVGIIAAPEIMAYARNLDGFVYISASHNPIGHNGIKFGLSDGGVIPGNEAAILIQSFRDLCALENSEQNAQSIIDFYAKEKLEKIYASVTECKNAALDEYENFTMRVVSGETDLTKQQSFFETIQNKTKKMPLSVVCDMNGSARCLSIDKNFLPAQGIGFFAFNNKVGNIIHAIIPEGKNLEYCAAEMEHLHKEGKTDVVLGYMPDCDGDRGNVVYWNTERQMAEVLEAQEVFALSVLSELTYSIYRRKQNADSTEKTAKLAIAANCPTSMRIEEIASAFDAKVARAEVGEANVVNRARELRDEGYDVPILGEGSNGGNITHPAAVRDPMNTLFALIKLLVLRSDDEKPGLFELWCKKSGQVEKYHKDFTLSDIIETLPVYTTTGVSEKRALLHIKSTDQTVLKQNFQKIFIIEWGIKKAELKTKYDICTWEAVATLGTTETRGISDFGISGTGGLKIHFMNTAGKPCAFMWMRGSGTEPVFRIMCDVLGNNPQMEKELLEWETTLLEKANTM